MLFLCGGGKISAGYRNHGKVRVKHMTQIDKNIAFNLKRIRKSKNMSLDMLAERTGAVAENIKRIRKQQKLSLERTAALSGVSRSMLGQIERGESNPTVSTIGKIVEGLKVPFEQLIYNRKEIMVVPSPEEAPVCKAKEGEYRIYVMLPYDAGRNFEIYQGELTRNARMESESHGEQTWEYLTVVSGEVELILEDSSFLVKTGGSLYFACDRKHVYHNVGETKAVLNMIITTQR